MFNPANSHIIGAWGLIITIFGALISIGGFYLTITQLSRTKRATQAVTTAVGDLKNRMYIFDTAVESVRVSRIIEQAIMLLRPGLESEAIPKLLEVQSGFHRLSISEGGDSEDRNEFAEIAAILFDHIAEIEISCDKKIPFDKNSLIMLLRKQINKLDTVGLKAQKAAYNVGT